MSNQSAPAPLGQSAKSPAKPEPIISLNHSEVADLLEALQGHWPCLSIHGRTYIKWTAKAVRELPEEVPAKLLMCCLHEINAHGRLFKAGTVDQLGTVQNSIRYRIMYPETNAGITVGLWRGLWGGVVGVCSREEMIETGALVMHVTSWLLKTLRMIGGNAVPRKGGLATQRWAWADADR